jgi:hypothetical protein
MDRGEVTEKLTAHNIAAFAKTGFKPLSYRLRTELGCEAWHWNPVGTWSDPARRQGYWTSSEVADKPIRLTWGYRLPRRGNTIDQANNDDYSRIDDGDPATYWKSNPYLDTFYTHEAESRHPQWVIVDFDGLTPVDAVRIRWANPYAVKFRVEYWTGENDLEPEDAPEGHWTPFPNGTVTKGRGGNQFISLGARANSRYYRLSLLKSSHTAEPAAKPDPRDQLGFAIRELDMGSVSHGRFHNEIDHDRSQDQTHIFTSSTDPWHRATDLDKSIEQPGFDFLFHHNLNHGQPLLVPAGILYNDPNEAAREARWLNARGYPIKGFELGEEPDGQHVGAQDFAALYRQAAERIHSVNPKLLTGGPSLQTIETDSAAWSDNRSDRSWMALFLESLARQKANDKFNFFSFEWYPFDLSYLPSEAQLRGAMESFSTYISRMHSEGVPNAVPWILAEYGYSAFAGPSDVQVQAALLNLDTIGTFFGLGGSEAFLYGALPDELISESKGHWGNLMTWLINDDGDAQYPMPTYWAAQLITRYWSGKASQPQKMLRCEPSSRSDLGCYALKRPDDSVAVLLVNRDANASKTLVFQLGDRTVRSGTWTVWGSAQYSWPNVTANSHPLKSNAPSTHRFKGSSVTLPPYSAAVAILN